MKTKRPIVRKHAAHSRKKSAAKRPTAMIIEGETAPDPQNADVQSGVRDQEGEGNRQTAELAELQQQEENSK